MSQSDSPHKLKVDAEELMFAIHDSAYEHHYYLDIENGRILFVDDETRHQLEEIYAGAPEDPGGEQDLDLEVLLSLAGLPDWEKQMLREANDVDNNFTEPYIEIPRIESNQAFEDMQEFAAGLKNKSIQDRLINALEYKHPFRRFKDELSNWPREREQWYEYSDQRAMARTMEWLREEGIEPQFIIKSDNGLCK